MAFKASVPGLLLLMALVFVRSQGLADTRPGKHTHDEKAPQGQTVDGHTHQHDKWESPPPEYASARSTRWDDPAAARRGEPLFQTHCLVCHGTDGRGMGPGAVGLPHAPADLTHHFHRSPGDGDAYLFWRVSEGGQVEPFRSMQSVMPAFKTVLSEDERWDIANNEEAASEITLAKNSLAESNEKHRRAYGCACIALGKGFWQDLKAEETEATESSQKHDGEERLRGQRP